MKQLYVGSLLSVLGDTQQYTSELNQLFNSNKPTLTDTHTHTHTHC